MSIFFACIFKDSINSHMENTIGAYHTTKRILKNRYQYKSKQVVQSMKKSKKIASILLATSISLTLLAGCSSVKAETTAATTVVATTVQSAARGGNGSFDPTTIQSLYTSVLQTLVTDKTITQDQADKVIAAITQSLTRNGSTQSGNRPSGGTAPSGGAQQPNGTAPSGRTQQPNGTAPSGAMQSGFGRSDMLSELVTSNVITQAQADTITQKIQEAMQNIQQPVPSK